MNKEYLANPLNKGKKKYKYYLRHLENYFKNFFTYFFIFPLIFPILLLNYTKKNKFYFRDFFNQNAVVYIVSILKQNNPSVFLFNLIDFHKVLSRFGLKYLLVNFSIFFGGNNFKTISFIDKDSDYYFNQDYFFYFDKNLDENKNNFVLPFYHTKNIYINNKIDSYKKLINSDKKFKIIFSGTSHNDWYCNFDFIDESKKKFLNRQDILSILKQNFSEKIYLVDNISKVDGIEYTDKDILLIETNPEINKRKKIFSEKKHLELISRSNFFLCMPGASMPLCYHLIESCLVGTVPILSYNSYIYPKFSDNEALFFFSKKELILSIEKALNISENNYSFMQKNIVNYYDEYLSPMGVYKSLLSKNTPLEIFANFDHTSSKHRLKRFNNN
jgi:hypothetical protein